MNNNHRPARASLVSYDFLRLLGTYDHDCQVHVHFVPLTIPNCAASQISKMSSSVLLPWPADRYRVPYVTVTVSTLYIATLQKCQLCHLLEYKYAYSSTCMQSAETATHQFISPRRV